MNEYERHVKRRWQLAKRVMGILKESNTTIQCEKNNTFHSGRRLHHGSFEYNYDSTLSYGIGSLFRSTIMGGRETMIVQKYFVLAMITQFEFPSPTMSLEKLLHAFFKTSSSILQIEDDLGRRGEGGGGVSRGDKRILLFTLLALEWKGCIMNHPHTFFFHCLHLISETDDNVGDDEYKIDDILCILSLGEINPVQVMNLRDCFLHLYYRHASSPQRSTIDSSSKKKNKLIPYVDKEGLKLIFELCPKLLLDFRDSIVQHFDSQDRLQDLVRKEESCMGAVRKISHHVIKLKVIRKWKYLLTHTLEAWFLYTQEEKKIHRIQNLLFETKCQRILCGWRLVTKSSSFAHKIHAMINSNLQQQILRNWKNYMKTSQNIKRICFKQSKRFKRLLVASGRLNQVYWRIQLRLQLHKWGEETRYLTRLSQAVAWSYIKIQRRSILAWRRVWSETKMRLMSQKAIGDRKGNVIRF